MNGYGYQRIGDEPYSDSEAIAMQPLSHTNLSKKKNIFPSHRRYHETLDSMNPIGSIPAPRDVVDDIVYNTNDEFGEGNAGIANNLKLVRTGRQRKKQASRSKGSEFQTRRKKRRVYFCCISSEIDIQKLYDYMTGPESEGKFNDWRLKLHNDVVHLYKAGATDAGETPKHVSSDGLRRTSSLGDDDKSKVMNYTDDEMMNESANESNVPRSFTLSSAPFRSKKSATFATNDEEIPISSYQQDPIDLITLDPSSSLLALDKLEDDGISSTNVNAKAGEEPSAYDNSLWKLSLPKVQEVFVFDFGAAVFWGFARGDEKNLLDTFKSFTTRGYIGESEFDRGEDDMGFVTSPDVDGISIANEVFTLPDDVSPKQRLSVSFAIAQSSVLAIFEARIERLIEDYKYIPESMASDGKARLTERQLGTMIGEVFVIRHDVNLHSEILDTPDFFWKQEEIEKDYQVTMSYLEMEARTEVLNKRLDMLRELLDVLQQQMENAHAVKLEWIVIWLIVIEVILQLIAVANEAGWWL